MLKIISKLSPTKSICECAECGTHYETNHYDARKSRIGYLCKLCKDPTGQEFNQALVKKFFTYDAVTGALKRRLPTTNNYVGEVVGTLKNNGYLSVGFGNKEYLVHRIIWLYQTGYLPEQVDHINHNKLDNSWSNLREVNNTNNSKNTSVSKSSTTKINGVSFMKSRNKYRATIMVNRKQIHLGLFADINDAIQARKDADIKYGFHSNHGS
jgi:hypothetical protein